MTDDTPEMQTYRTELHKALDTHFDTEELHTLCTYLSIEYQNLPGEGKSAKARELIAVMARQVRLPE